MKPKLHILSPALLSAYNAALPKDLRKQFAALQESPLSTKSFSFYTSVSAIASSKIEGEKMEVDSYVKHRMLKTAALPDLVQKPDDLYKAYTYAQKHPLSRTAFLQAHKQITAHLLPAKSRGAIRTTEMFVLEHKTGRIQYEAAPKAEVKALFNDLWALIRQLLKAELTTAEAFLYASWIHLVFVNIHPFEDGNGRAGRLLEKWFLVQKLGPKAWYLQSELYYYHNVNTYYKNLNRLGLFYSELDYSKALPFLLMLPEALKK